MGTVSQKESDEQRGSSKSSKGTDSERRGSHDSAISEVVRKEVHFVDSVTQREKAISDELSKLERKIDQDERDIAETEYKLEESERETFEAAKELEKMRLKEKKSEAARLERMRRIEAKTIKIAKEIADMQKAEKDREGDKIAQILNHEKETRRISARIVEKYAEDRKRIEITSEIISLVAEQELLKIVNAANEAHKTLHELAEELGKRQREAIDKETELINLERIAKKRTTEMEDVVNAGKRELHDLTEELKEDSWALSVAEGLYREAVCKREEAESVFEQLKSEEEMEKRKLDRFDEKILKDQRAYTSMTRGLSNLTKEAEDAELFALSKSETSEAGEAVKPFDPARQIARKRSHEMTQVVEAGKKELLEVANELNYDSKAIADAEGAHIEAMFRRGEAEKVLNMLKRDEENSKRSFDNMKKKIATDQHDYHLMTQELLNIKEETQAAENFAEVQKRLHESRAEEQAETAETANEGFRNAEKVLKRLESEKRVAAARVEELKMLESLARERAAEIEKSTCLIEEKRRSLINVVEHKRYEIEEQEMGVKFDENPRRQTFEQKMGEHSILFGI